MRNPFPIFTAALALTWGAVSKAFDWLAGLNADFCMWICGAAPAQTTAQPWPATETGSYTDPMVDKKVLIVDRFHAYHGEVGTIEHVIDAEEPSYMVSFLDLPGLPVAILSPLQFIEQRHALKAAA